jgi:hypothetical protein
MVEEVEDEVEVVEVAIESLIRVTFNVTTVKNMVTLQMNVLVRRKNQIVMQNLQSKKMKKHY